MNDESGRYKRLCVYCKKPVTGERMHPGCLVDDVYDTIARGEKITEVQKQRCKYRKIKIGDIRRAVMQDACGKLPDDYIDEENITRIELIEE